MGFFVERTNYTRLANVAYAIISDLLAQGFTQAAPVQAWSEPAEFAPFSIALTPSASVNALQTQQYVVRIEMTSVDTMKFDVSTPTLLDTTTASLQYVDSEESTKSLFWNRQRATSYNAWPMSYVLSITERGFAFCIWENDQDKNANQYAWAVVQRPVDKTTGSQLVASTSKCPVFCIIKTHAIDDIEYFTVRESDIQRPSKRVTATRHTEDASRIINSKKQVMITEDGTYIIDYPNRLNTARYAYTQELDMIGITSADVISQGSDIATTVYGESSPRTYFSLVANGVNNTSMRPLILKSGGGI